MLVSVLISVFERDDAEQFEQALLSILKDQTLKPDQVILVVDGFIGKQLTTVLKALEDQFDCLMVHRRTENSGLAAALNFGLKFCHGEFIARMDADDISLPNRLETQVNFLIRNPEVGLVGGWVSEFGEGTPHRIIRYPLTHSNIISALTFRSPLSHPTVVFRAKVIKANLYDSTLKTTQDLELWFRLAERGVVFANVPEVVLHFRLNNSFFDRRSRSKAINELKIYLRGIYGLHGLSVRHIVPIARFVFRLMPKIFVRFAYKHRQNWTRQIESCPGNNLNV